MVANGNAFGTARATLVVAGGGLAPSAQEAQVEASLYESCGLVSISQHGMGSIVTGVTVPELGTTNEGWGVQKTFGGTSSIGGLQRPLYTSTVRYVASGALLLQVQWSSSSQSLQH